VNPEAIVIRPLETQADFQQCVALQREIWGDDFGEAAPPSILLATRQVGGVAAGAFDEHDRMVGFVFGINGLRDGQLAHWSDMLGVKEDVRGAGLGRRLKAHQRDHLLALGIERCYWSYDPLEARNAYLNIQRLGAQPLEYVLDMYGDASPSPLLAGLSTDRFIVEWRLKAPRVEAALAGVPAVESSNAAAAPIVNTEPQRGEPRAGELDLPDAPAVRVEVPFDIQRVKLQSAELARAWRRSTRQAFAHYLGLAYQVTGFRRDLETDRCFYVLDQHVNDG
jgi:predicted GNAT superfamily acetyltransferase